MIKQSKANIAEFPQRDANRVLMFENILIQKHTLSGVSAPRQLFDVFLDV